MKIIDKSFGLGEKLSQNVLFFKSGKTKNRNVSLGENKTQKKHKKINIYKIVMLKKKTTK